MGSDLTLVKAAHLNPIAKLRGHHFAKFPGGIATGRVEIDMRMPARDTRHIEIRHCHPFGQITESGRPPLQPIQYLLSYNTCRTPLSIRWKQELYKELISSLSKSIVA
jgi:hypothetical protein